MVEVLVGAQQELWCQRLLVDEGLESSLLGAYHAPWVYDGGLTCILIVEDIGILLHGAEYELVYLEHFLIHI